MGHACNSYNEDMVSRIRFLFLLVSVSTGSAALAESPEVFSRTLDNGLQVLVQQDTRAPVAVQQLWYGVGASSERPGETGVSHFLEHMMFRGTARFPGETFSHTIAARGGRDNAFTGRDYTAYYQVLGNDQLEVAMEMEADRMQNLLLAEPDIRKEMEVVKEERRLRTEDQPEALAFEQLQATAFQNHPYGQPVIGWMGDIGQLGQRELRAWHQRWYVPNNARLVVVGDVEPKRIFDLAEKHFGDIPRGADPARPPRPEPVQRGPRRNDLHIPAQTEYLLIAYKAPSMARMPEQQHWEAYALSMLASILDGGDAARLPKRLVRDSQVAASAGASYSLYSALDSLLVLDATPSQGRTAAEVEQALLAEITELQTQPVSEAELQRARAQVIAHTVYAQDSLRHRAYMIGMLETNGLGWETRNRLVAGYQSVTAAQVQEVAQRYLTAAGRTTVTVHPLRDARVAQR